MSTPIFPGPSRFTHHRYEPGPEVDSFYHRRDCELTVRAFLEAEAYEGPAIIIAYSHCIAHGIQMATAMRNQKAAVDCGQWLLYRFDPRRSARGENPLQLDSPPPRMKSREYFGLEGRFQMLVRTNPEQARKVFDQAQREIEARRAFFERLATPATHPSSP